MTLELGVIGVLGLALLGSILGNVFQARRLGIERARNGILEAGLRQAKEQMERTTAPTPVSADEQLDRL